VAPKVTPPGGSSGKHAGLAQEMTKRPIVGASSLMRPKHPQQGRDQTPHPQLRAAGRRKKRATRRPLKLLSASGHEETLTQRKNSFGKRQGLHAETFIEITNLQQ